MFNTIKSTNEFYDGYAIVGYEFSTLCDKNCSYWIFSIVLNNDENRQDFIDYLENKEGIHWDINGEPTIIFIKKTKP